MSKAKYKLTAQQLINRIAKDAATEIIKNIGASGGVLVNKHPQPSEKQKAAFAKNRANLKPKKKTNTPNI